MCTFQQGIFKLISMITDSIFISVAFKNSNLIGIIWIQLFDGFYSAAYNLEITVLILLKKYLLYILLTENSSLMKENKFMQ